jgi:hypothetical protein
MLNGQRSDDTRERLEIALPFESSAPGSRSRTPAAGRSSGKGSAATWVDRLFARDHGVGDSATRRFAIALLSYDGCKRLHCVGEMLGLDEPGASFDLLVSALLLRAICERPRPGRSGPMTIWKRSSMAQPRASSAWGGWFSRGPVGRSLGDRGHPSTGSSPDTPLSSARFRGLFLTVTQYASISVTRHRTANRGQPWRRRTRTLARTR